MVRLSNGVLKLGVQVIQIFTKNNNQWRAKPITDEEAASFHAALVEHRITHPLSHASYLINLASPDETLRQKSIDAMVIELERAAQLNIPYVVMHPGSFTTSDEETGIANIARSLDELHRRIGDISSCVLLENTAGQGSNLGWRFEQLQSILESVAEPERLGVCIDTCHAFAAGYPLDPKNKYDRTMRTISRTVGLKRVKAFHLNDSKRPFGSRRDRHEHIGRGEMGLEPFRILLNDKRWRHIPMYLETPKGTEDGRDLDEMNLETLRGLVEVEKKA